MFRGIALLSTALCLGLTACKSGHNSDSMSLVGPNEVEITYEIGGEPISHVYPISSAPPDTALPVSMAMQCLSVIGKDQNGEPGAEYRAVIGPGAVAFLTPERWLRVDSGWAYVLIPHDPGGSPLWSPMRWPWVSGGGVRAGVSGFAAQDHVIITHYPPGPSLQTLVFYSATGSGSSASQGQVRVGTGPLTTVNPTTQYVRAGVLTPFPLDLATEGHLNEIRDLAAHCLSVME